MSSCSSLNTCEDTRRDVFLWSVKQIKMGILDRIADIEKEMARTQKNKATEHHLGILKAKVAKLRAQLLEPQVC